MHYTKTLTREFTRRCLKNFGIEYGLEDTKLVLETRSQTTWRRLDDKKRKQLESLFLEYLTELFAEDELISPTGVLITKVEATPVFSELRIYWKCFGDDRDEAVVQAFEASSPSLRRRLSDRLYNSIIPVLRFIPDRTELITEEMNHLFEIADYGMQYRAVSQTGAILGSTKETGEENPAEKSEKMPRWLAAIYKRKKAAAAEKSKEQHQPDDKSSLTAIVESKGSTIIETQT